MKNKKMFCWDLDETLGNFRKVAYEMTDQKIPDHISPLSIKPGIAGLLSSLNSKGHKNFVTTASDYSYAREALYQTGLIEYFKRIFDKKSLCDLDLNKFYFPVVRNENISIEEASKNMIVIGNSERDQPSDLTKTVFIEDRESVYLDSPLIEKIIHRLDEFGEGSFIRGFEKMYDNSKVEGKDHYLLPYREKRVFDLEEGVRMDLEYRMVPKRNSIQSGPVITNIRSTDYLKDPVLIG